MGEIKGNENILSNGYDTWENFDLGPIALFSHSLMTTEITRARSMSGKALKLRGTGTDGYVYLGDNSNTDYFLHLEKGRRYFFSFYYNSADTSNLQLYIKDSNGFTDFRGYRTYQSLDNWERIYWDFTPKTDDIAIRFDLDTPNIDGYFDNFMVEQAFSGQTEPTEFKGFNEFSLKTDWTSDDYYNAEDLNRVENATRITGEKISQFRNTPINQTTVIDRSEKSIEFADSLNRIENNILVLSEILNNRVKIKTPKIDWHYNAPFDFNDANRLEQNLESLYRYTVLNKANIPYAGQYITGQEGVI